MIREQFNVRLPVFTLETIDLICETYGLTKTQVVILAVDRLARDINPERIATRSASPLLDIAKVKEQNPDD